MKILCRVLLSVTLGWIVLVEVVAAFARIRFGIRVDGDWFLMLAASSPSEMREFCRIYSVDLTLAAAACVVLLATIGLVAACARGRGMWIALAVALVYVGWNCRTVGRAMTWPPLFVAYDTGRSLSSYLELLRAGAWSGEVLPGVEERPQDSVTNLVFVIGESMTTDRMSLYGYGKKTTPFLDGRRKELSVLGPVRATHATTVPALRLMLTRATVQHPGRAGETLAVALRRRGYRPVLISLQPRWGRRCGVGQMLFAACETRTYLADCEKGMGCPDDAAVSFLQREMAIEDSRPFAVFVHLQGSHFDPRQRVPPDFETPRDFDPYDRSIAYTDAVLEGIIRSLPPRTLMVYLSDHGESPDSSGWRDNDSPSMWKVPLLLWPRQAAPCCVTTTDQAFDLVLGLLDGKMSVR